MNFKNYYKHQNYGDGKNFFKNHQICLIEEIAKNYDNSPAATGAYNLSRSTAPIYLATKDEATRVYYKHLNYHNNLINNLKHQLESKKREQESKKAELESKKAELPLKIRWNNTEDANKKDSIDDNSINRIIAKIKEKITEINKKIAEIDKIIDDINKQPRIRGPLAIGTLLGWFEPNTGDVKICIDAIENVAMEYKIDFNNLLAFVVLHELSHALMFNERHTHYEQPVEHFMEESLADKIALKYLEMGLHSSEFTKIKNYIEKKPRPYKAGLILFDYDVCDCYKFQQCKEFVASSFALNWLIYMWNIPYSNKSRQQIKEDINSLFYDSFGFDEPGNSLQFLEGSNVYVRTLLHKILNNACLLPGISKYNLRLYVPNSKTSPSPYAVMAPSQWAASRKQGGKYEVKIGARPFNYNKMLKTYLIIEFPNNDKERKSLIKYLDTKLVKFIVAAYNSLYSTKRLNNVPRDQGIGSFIDMLPIPDIVKNCMFLCELQNPNDIIYNLFGLDEPEKDFIENFII